MTKTAIPQAAGAIADTAHDKQFARIGIAAVAAAVSCQHLPEPAKLVHTAEDDECWGDDHDFVA
ncbi:hypothetical protein [Rhodoplanes roseus]|uniref:Uncharacterized protein n=1 Tax=Rhodoplanes roseus TaxID=29409 RepID=A0A327L1D7_9BRAD|nr:hypothetical protein [Rhodoplanes roseus]RAI44271.1 hypothetical protein CH341_09930 [Rhodoplanes roseus]